MSGLTLLTGATGFVGSHVAEACREEGHRLRCTVRATSDTRWIEGLGVETVEVDLADPGRLDEVMEGVRTVVHVAGVTVAADRATFARVNVEGTRSLALAARRSEVRRFVYMSSLAARGPDGAEGPVSPYGASKRDAEACLRDAAGEMEVVVLRPGGVYGPRDADLLSLFRLADRGWLPAPRGGAPLQPVYAADVADAAVRAAGREAPGFGPYPLAERDRYGWEEVAEGMEAALGRPVRLVEVPGAVFLAAGAAGELVGRALGRTPELDRRQARDLARHSWTCDPSATERELGWRAGVELPEGLRRTASWYRGQGWL